MEKPPFRHIDRYIGDSNRIEEFLRRRETAWRKRLQPIELEKSPSDEAIIDLADRVSTQMLEKYERSAPVRVASSRIHLIPHKEAPGFFEDAGTRGRYSAFGHAVVARNPSETQMALTIFHEMIHLKSYQAVQVTKDGGVQTYRGGFRTVSRDGRGSFSLDDLNEAVVAELTGRFYTYTVEKHPLFQQDLVSQKGPPAISRMRERKALDELCNDIARLKKEAFTSSEEVKEVFIKAGLTGNLLPIARLIEETYGIGSFQAFVGADRPEEFLEYSKGGLTI